MSGFTAWYTRQLKSVLPVVYVLALIVQVSLSLALSPRGSRSKTINAIFCVAFCVALFALDRLDEPQSALVLAYIGPTLLVGTRIIRAVMIMHSSPEEAGDWLSLGRDRPVTKFVSAMAAGLILTCSSVGLGLVERLGILVVCELCRFMLIFQAAGMFCHPPNTDSLSLSLPLSPSPSLSLSLSLSLLDLTLGSASGLHKAGARLCVAAGRVRHRCLRRGRIARLGPRSVGAPPLAAQRGARALHLSAGAIRPAVHARALRRHILD